MPTTPAMTTGMSAFITRSGRDTPIPAMPAPAFAVPYAAPRFDSAIAAAAPKYPKKGALAGQARE